MDRRRPNRFVPVLIGAALAGWGFMQEAFSGFGGHSKAKPIQMVRGRNQSRWRKKLRRMDHSKRRLILKRRAKGAA